MKKNNFIAIGIASVIAFANISNAVAQNTSSQESSAKLKHSELSSCLHILWDNVKKDERFGAIDLSALSIDNKTTDITEYSEFYNNLQKNGNSKSFFANRNNIGTIIMEDQYIVTEFLTFGSNTAFTFPYKNPKSSSTNKTDSYGDLKDRIVYMHYLKSKDNKKWVLLSCGFIKISPNGKSSLSDLGASNYKTNFLSPSGFELLKTQNDPFVDQNGNRFLVGKVNVPIKNYSDEHHMTLELITVAFDNKNSYFNEFETFPIQVKAMTNEDKKVDINEAQKKFLKWVEDETCLKIAHKDIKSLPSKCEKEFKSLTIKENKVAKNKSSSFWDYVIPKVAAEEINAQATIKNNSSDDPYAGFSDNDDYSHLPSGMYLNSALSLENFKKLESLNDPLLTNHVLKALSDGIEYDMEKDSTGSTLQAHDNRVFLQCGIDYETRVKLLNQWIESIDVNTFSIENITYPDPKIGDCIIPYPDARHKDQIIENSFLTNQYNAAVRSGNEEKIQELSPMVKSAHDNSKFWMNSSLMMILGVIILLWGVTLIAFLLKNKKSN